MRWSNAPDMRKPRALLIGDSIANGYHRFAAEQLNRRFNVDLLATSKSLDDQGLLRELEYMFSECKYAIVHFNNGLHGLHQSVKAYERNLNRLLRNLRQLAGKAKLLWASSTPVVCLGGRRRLDPKLNKLVISRNLAARRVMERAQIPVNDLYQAVAGRVELRAADQHHYNPAGYEYLGNMVAVAILKAC